MSKYNSNNLKQVHLYFDDILTDGNIDLLDEIIHPAYIHFQNIYDPKVLNLGLMNEELLGIRGVEGIKRRIKSFSEMFWKF